MALAWYAPPPTFAFYKPAVSPYFKPCPCSQVWSLALYSGPTSSSWATHASGAHSIWPPLRQGLEGILSAGRDKRVYFINPKPNLCFATAPPPASASLLLEAPAPILKVCLLLSWGCLGPHAPFLKWMCDMCTGGRILRVTKSFQQSLCASFVQHFVQLLKDLCHVFSQFLRFTVPH